MIQTETTTAGRFGRAGLGGGVDLGELRRTEGQAMGSLQAAWAGYTEEERSALQEYQDQYSKQLKAEQESLESEIGRAGSQTKRLTEKIEVHRRMEKLYRSKAAEDSWSRSKRRHQRRVYRYHESERARKMGLIIPKSELNVARAGEWAPPEQQGMMSTIRGGESVMGPSIQKAATTGMAAPVPMEEAGEHLRRFQDIGSRLGGFQEEYDRDVSSRNILAEKYAGIRGEMTGLIGREQAKIRKPLREAGWI